VENRYDYDYSPSIATVNGFELLRLTASEMSKVEACRKTSPSSSRVTTIPIAAVHRQSFAAVTMSSSQAFHALAKASSIAPRIVSKGTRAWSRALPFLEVSLSIRAGNDCAVLSADGVGDSRDIDSAAASSLLSCLRLLHVIERDGLTILLLAGTSFPARRTRPLHWRITQHVVRCTIQDSS
jgi:hypothetical protein